MCNGLDDDLDGLVSVGALDGGVGEAGVFDAGREAGVVDGGMDGGRIDAGVMDGGGLDGGSIDGGGIDGGVSDLDLFVDEDFRDSIGRYITDAHCGRCGAACSATREHELEAHCGLVDEYPTCVATRCDAGFVPSSAGRCVPIYERLCLFCADDGDCGDFEGARCASIGDEQRCAIDCALGCPDGYACTATSSGDVCAPTSGSCTCAAGDDFNLACALEDPEGLFCPGSAVCRDGVLSSCVAPPEECDHEDDDCNGVPDDGFVDRLGAYSLDIHNCGDCGVDCTLSSVPEGDLVCGGDPFAPSCVLHCPDTDDGIDIGDRVDGDRLIATGCECTVSALTDEAGPVRTAGSALDVNCDGADGIVVESFYVAPDGDDAAIGSPTRPLRTLTVAFQRAHDSITSTTPRPHVFIASGTYAESVELPDGVLVHGGYRRDFLALDPDGFRVEIRAPSATTAPGGAAVVIRGAGTSPTLLEWVFVRGRDATMEGAATFGIYAIDPGAALTLRDLEVRSGAAGTGGSGTRGSAGASFESLPGTGAPPRGAAENTAHACLGSDARNTVAGGAGGVNRCGGVDVSGGTGGSARCPMMSAFQPSGTVGRPAGSLSGGSGGSGGQDSRGPITADTGTCPVDVCCGLADFSVPTDFIGPQPGGPGIDGSNGRAGGACTEPFGRFMGDVWDGMDATGGANGTPGSGGGGGGASVGVWVTGLTREPTFVAAWRTGNTFTIGAPGPAGRGGGGPSAGADGAEGGASDVLVR